MEISLLNAGQVDVQRADKTLSSHYENSSSPIINSAPSSFSDVMMNVSNSKITSENAGAFLSMEQFSSSLNGDYLSSFKVENPTEQDRHAMPQGAARGMVTYSPLGEESIRTIDKTSILYEKALELESYVVKIMMDSMRSTLSEQSVLGDESFASKMYKDMMYDQLNRTLTKNAGFGLADQIYLQLNK